MSSDIVNEVIFLSYSIAMGILITFVYDWLLIMRRLIRHNAFFVSLEDLLFWAACAICVFYMLYAENNGVLRWFAVLGAGVGMLIYKKTVSRFFVKFMAAGIGKISSFIGKIIGTVLRPFSFLYRKSACLVRFLARKTKKGLIHLKKKLTVSLKLLKIALCKR